MADISNILAMIHGIDLPDANQVVPTWQSPDAQQPSPIAQAGYDPSAALPQTNALQALVSPQPDQPTPYQAPTSTYQPQDAPAVAAPVAPPRPRVSALEAIGNIADALAVAGGKAQGYQGGLDAQLARTQAAQDRPGEVQLAGLQRQHIQQQINSGAADTAKDAWTTNASRYGASLRGLQAIAKANPQADLASAWGALAKQNGIPDADAQQIWGTLQANPGAIDGLASQFEKSSGKGGGTEYGLNPVFTKDANGRLIINQLGKDGSIHQAVLPEGQTVADALHFADQGNQITPVGVHGGQALPPMLKFVAPDTAATVGGANMRSAATIAAEAARQQAGFAHTDANKPSAAKGDPAGALSILDNIQKGFGDLHGMNALPGEGGAVGNVLGALGRTGIGQAIGQQAGNAAAQKRLEITKNVSQLQQEMLKSLPASAVRTKFEQEMLARALPDPTKMSLATAQTVIGQLRSTYLRAVQQSSAPAARPVLSPKSPPASSGWGQVVRH